LALLATAVAGFTATWCGVSLQAAIQTDLPDAYRGRVMSLWTVVGFGTVAIGAGLIGGLAEVMGSAPRWWWRLSRTDRNGAVALRGCTRLKYTLSRGANDMRAQERTGHEPDPRDHPAGPVRLTCPMAATWCPATWCGR
jgi:hypothetical protein